jgi:hypothetical protein
MKIFAVPFNCDAGPGLAIVSVSRGKKAKEEVIKVLRETYEDAEVGPAEEIDVKHACLFWAEELNDH